MDNKLPSFRSSMNGQELINTLSHIRKGLDTYAHDVSLEHGEFVVHLRKPSLSERMKMALMPAKMREERVMVLNMIILDIAGRIGIDGGRLLRDIRHGSGANMEDKINIIGTEMALKRSPGRDMLAD